MSGSPFSYRSFKLYTGLVVGILLPVNMIAQVDRSKAPEPGPAPAVHLSASGSFSLPNGLKVIVVEDHKLPLVSVQVRLDIPPIAQGDRAGLVEMVGDLLGAGTATRTKAQLDEAVDALGAHLGTGHDGVYINGLSKHLESLLEIASDVTLAASFPDAEVEKLRTRMLSTVQQRRSDPDSIAEAVGRSATFGRVHPYGEVTKETTLKGIKTEDVRAYYEYFFRPEKGYLIFVGDITLKQAKKLAKKYFGKWKSPNAKFGDANSGQLVIPVIGTVHTIQQPTTPRGDRRVVLVDRPGAKQSVIRVSYPLELEPRDLRNMSAQVMNTILGGGVFNARLMQNLREDKGYTYGAYSVLEADRYNGSFTASVSVRTEVTDSSVIEIIKEMDRLREDLVTQDELDLAKKYMAGSFARSLEDPRTVARFALNIQLNSLEKDHYDSYLQRLDAITPEDVRAAALAFLHPDNAVIFVVGDKENVQRGLIPLSKQSNMPIMQVDENGDRWKERPLDPITDRSANEIIEAYITAVGGRDAIALIKDLRIHMTGMVSEKELSITNWYEKGGKFRTETKLGKDVVEEVIMDGSRAVLRNGQESVELEDIGLEEVERMAMPIPEVEMERIAENVILVGHTKVNERPAFKVHIATISGTGISDYYDAETGLRLRREEQRTIAGRALLITTDYSDYKAEGGVMFPRSTYQTGGPMGGLRFTVKELVLNKGMVPGFFETGLGPQE